MSYGEVLRDMMMHAVENKLLGELVADMIDTVARINSALVDPEERRGALLDAIEALANGTEAYRQMIDADVGKDAGIQGRCDNPACPVHGTKH